MPRIFKHLEAGCLQVNLMSTSAQINQLKYTIPYYTIVIREPDHLRFISGFHIVYVLKKRHSKILRNFAI